VEITKESFDADIVHGIAHEYLLQTVMDIHPEIIPKRYKYNNS